MNYVNAMTKVLREEKKAEVALRIATQKYETAKAVAVLEAIKAEQIPQKNADILKMGIQAFVSQNEQLSKLLEEMNKAQDNYDLCKINADVTKGYFSMVKAQIYAGAPRE